MVIISIANIKGGTGKTQTIINLAQEFSKHKKTLLIDNDPQSSATQILLPNETEFEATMYDVYTDKDCKISDCIYLYNENLGVVPNDLRGMKLDLDLVNKMNREQILKNKLNSIPDEFEYVLIDNSPYMGLVTQNALVASDYTMCVIDSGISSIYGLNILKLILGELHENGLVKNTQLLGILRNGFVKNTKQTKEINSIAEEALTDEILSDIVYRSVKYSEATSSHQTIQEYAPDHAKVYESITKELLQRINEREGI